MRETVNGSLFIQEYNEHEASFIYKIVYDARKEILSVVMRNETVYNYAKVPMETFVEFTVTKSKGGYYNNNIKSKFKHLIMAKEETTKKQPNKINKAGDFKRFIKMSIDVTKINKAWLYKSDKGAVYLKCTLMMLPDGEVGKYGQLGMVVQDTPAEIAKVDKEARGEILGNGEELEWTREEEKVERITAEDEDIMGELPF
jgi:hypothetical protein